MVIEWLPANVHDEEPELGTHADAASGELPPLLCDKPDLGRGRLVPLKLTVDESPIEYVDYCTLGCDCTEAWMVDM